MRCSNSITICGVPVCFASSDSDDNFYLSPSNLSTQVLQSDNDIGLWCPAFTSSVVVASAKHPAASQIVKPLPLWISLNVSSPFCSSDLIRSDSLATLVGSAMFFINDPY